MIHNKEYGAAMEELQAENDALKAKVFIIHSAARFVVDADGEEGRDYHLAGLERALNLNQNECLAQVKQDAVIDAMHGNIIEPGEVTTDYFCEVPALEKYAANLLPPATEQDA